MLYALLILMAGETVTIESYPTMMECEIRKAEIYQQTQRKARCLWMQEPKPNRE
jgi:hypothetical protein